MKTLTYILLSLISLTLTAQNESLFSGLNFASFFIDASGPFSGTDTLISDGAGNGTFTGGTYTYTVDEDLNFIFVEDFGTETHTYIGATDPTGEYAILIPDPSDPDAPDELTGMVSTVKLSDGKSNSSFNGDYITTYYRYDSPSDMFVGLFLVTADGIDTCTYHQLMGTDPADDEDFSYAVDNEGRIALANNIGMHVISAAINNTEDCYTYASILPGFNAAGNGVKKLGELEFSEVQGEYKLMQLRYEDSYGEQSSSLLTISINGDGTGTYVVDTNSHGETSAGTLAVSYQADGIWEIVLDNDSDYTIYGAINPTERLITGYFNFKGVTPGIIFGISKETNSTPNYTISGTVIGADGVSVAVTGDITESILINHSGDSYSLEVAQGQSIVLTPEKAGFSFTPASITLNDIQEDADLESFTAIPNSSLHTISGGVVGTNGILISLTGDLTDSQTIDEGDVFSFNVSSGDNITVTPSKDGFNFTPASISITDVQTDSILETFSAAIKTFTITGTITGANGVLVSMTGDASDSQTIDEGLTYSFTVDYGQSVIITPEKDDFSFTPASISLNAVAADQSGQDFSATPTIIGTEDITSGSIKIYPNPVNHLLNIEATNLLTVELVEVTGKVLESYDCSSKTSIQIDLSSKPSGLYLIRLTNDKGISQKKIMKY